jgi:acyl dehydratase
MPRFAFEDFTPGSTRILGPITVSKDEIVAFAREYDPQPFHTDEIAAKDTFVGTLIASGWHTCSINMRLLADEVILDSTSMGSPGIEELKWAKPVRPGDTLRSRMTVLESRASKSRSTLGLVKFQFEVANQTDEVVMVQTNWVMFGRRGTSLAVNGTRSLPPESPVSPAPATEMPPISANPYLDDLVVGQTEVLGSFTYPAEAIIRFAKAYDPQRFHVDPVAAKESLFGDLCASGWQTASVWMKLMAAHRHRIRADALARGERPAQLGPSPGFRNLKWLKPVYAGDTITYRSTVTDRRASASRPGWGIASHHNTGVNQHGEEVFSFDGAVFWERRTES